MTPTKQRKNPVKRLYNGLGPPPEPVAPPAEHATRIPVVTGQPVELVYCLKHSCKLPCATCRLMNWLETETVKHQENIGQQAADEWRKIAEFTGIRPDQKCVHGMYLAEHYCEVCRFEPIDPTYNPEIYRTEIKKALAHAKGVLYSSEGHKDFKDLSQIVDIQIWKATKKYGGTMNVQLAYRVARNQVDGYLKERIKEQTITLTDDNGNPVLAPRFTSFEVKAKDENGKPMDISLAEKEIVDKEKEGGAGDWLQGVHSEGGFPALLQLASTWYGDKRRVAEAMLQPGFTVRSVPGLSKSSVARIRQVVLVAFKAFITQDLKNNSK
jgi:hypothetical protein